jgi:hypothetical protein
VADIATLTRSAVGSHLRPADMRARLEGSLDNWRGLLSRHTTEARGVLDEVLADRIGFTPNVEQRRYTLTIPIAFDRVLSCVVPEARVLQDMVTSPTGCARVGAPETFIEGDIAA